MAYAKRIFAVLADDTRRSIFERVAERPQTVGEIAAELPVSRPAVSQHLAALKAAGLVHDEAQGARRVYRIDPKGLGPLRAWLDRFWDDALSAFQREIDKEESA